MFVDLQVQADQLTDMLPLLEATDARIVVKISGYAKFSAESYPYRDAWPYVQSLLQAFGPDSCVWGSDWPSCGLRSAGPPLGDLPGRPINAWADGARGRALAAAAEQAGVTVIRRGPFAPTLDGGSAAGDIGLASGATALVAFNDRLAIGVLQRLQHLGVDVPGQVSVVGYDDIFGSNFCHPPLTTITAPIDQAGRTLIDLLLGERDVQRAAQVVLPTVLRARDSTGPAPA